MRRFYRGEKPTEEEVKQKSAEIAVKEVDRFREANSRYPNRKEIDLISENVFEQLKAEIGSEDAEEKAGRGAKHGQSTGASAQKSFLESRRERRGAQQAKGKEGPARVPVEGGKGKKGPARKKPAEEELEGLGQEFGEGAGEEGLGEIPESFGGPSGDTDEEKVAQLAGLEELAGLEKDLMDDGSDLVEKEIDSDLNMCPNCGNRAEDLLYCPNCGEAFCDHCAKAVEAQKDGVKYTCPKCGKDFKKSTRAQQ